MLYLVIDEGSGEGSALTLANNEEHAIAEARAVFGYTDEEPGDLRAVSKHSASEPTRSLLAFWDAVATEAMDRGFAAKVVEDELRSLQVLLTAALDVHRQSVARSVNVEFERCSTIVDKKRREALSERGAFAREDPGYDRHDGAADALGDVFSAIRARSKGGA